MAKNILAVEPLSCNEISVLAQLLEVSFDYYINNNSPFFTDYLKSLRTLVGLGFTATLADRCLLRIYQHYLNRFMMQKEGNFRENTGAKTLIAQSTAQMVGTAAMSFSALRCPRYYEDFVVALHYTLSKVPIFVAQQHEVERIMARFCVKN